MVNQNKTAHSNSRGLTIYYTDKKTFMFFPYSSRSTNNTQLYGSSVNNIQYQDKSQSKYENTSLTEKQAKLYQDALHGLSIYDKVVISNMSFAEKLTIEHRYNNAQFVLNKWKQSIINNEVDVILNKLFPSSKLIQEMTGSDEYFDENLVNNQSFAELNISKKQIIDKLIKENVLPGDFY